MSNPWDDFVGPIEATLTAGVKEIASDLKDEYKAFLKDVAIRSAKETWRAIHGDDEEKEIAKSNLELLKGQVIGEAARMALAQSEKAETILKAVLNIAISFAKDVLVPMAIAALKAKF